MIFTSFLSAKLPDSQSWINELKPMAADYAFDCYLVAEIEKDLLAISDAKTARALAEKVRTAQNALKVGGKLSARLKSIETELIAKDATR